MKGRCVISFDLGVDAEALRALREEVRSKYREVAVNPHGRFHFHTGRPLAKAFIKNVLPTDLLRCVHDIIERCSVGVRSAVIDRPATFASETWPTFRPAYGNVPTSIILSLSHMPYCIDIEKLVEMVT